jgi:anti-sigma B factor antagonist
MTSAAFTITLDSAEHGRRTITVSGEIDVTNAADFITSVDGVPGHGPLIVDLSGLRYLDSAGFAALFHMLDKLAIVVVVDPRSPIRPAATLVGLPCHDNVDAALASQQAW